MKHLTPMIFAVVALIFFLAGATAQAQEKAKEKAKENNRKGIGIELAPPVRAKEYMKGRRYALLIGINDYKDPKIPDLVTCENDAKSLHRLLTDSQIGGVDKDAAVLLLGKQATTRNIKKALANLRQIPVDSTIFVYFSGHGAKEADEAFWVTHDSEIDSLAASALADREVRAFLARIPSKRVVVMIDACYAAATIKGGKTLANDFSSVLKKFTGKGRAFLMAAGSGEEAIEAKDLKHSVFTHYLLQGLGGKADSNNDGVIVLTELTTYIDEHVAEEARIRGGIQKPVVSLIDVQEPAKFRLTINAARLRQNQLETAEIRTLRRKRLGELKTLALDSRITVEQYRQGEALLEALESDLDRLNQKRLAEYAAVADGTLPTEKLTKALELIGRNKSVGAFRETIEVSHVGYLGEQLNKRGKQLEEAATRRMLKLVE